VQRTNESRVRLWAVLMVMTALLTVSCRSAEPRSDLEYLVWEVCRQIRAEGVTADQVAGILHDATRHGPVMELIEAECGDDITDIYSPDP